MPEIDQGHEKLIGGIEALLEDARNYHFHDFKNTIHAAPKMELVKRLRAMVENVPQGIYDN